MNNQVKLLRKVSDISDLVPAANPSIKKIVSFSLSLPLFLSTCFFLYISLYKTNSLRKSYHSFFILTLSLAPSTILWSLYICIQEPVSLVNRTFISPFIFYTCLSRYNKQFDQLPFTHRLSMKLIKNKQTTQPAAGNKSYYRGEYTYKLLMKPIFLEKYFFNRNMFHY